MKKEDNIINVDFSKKSIDMGMLEEEYLSQENSEENAKNDDAAEDHLQSAESSENTDTLSDSPNIVALPPEEGGINGIEDYVGNDAYSLFYETYEKIEELSLTVERNHAAMKAIFDKKIMSDLKKNQIIDILHDELQKYKDDMFAKIFRPILFDILSLKEDISKLQRSAADKDDEYFTKSKFISTLKNYSLDIMDILEKYDVESYSEESDKYIPIRQKIIKVIDSSNPENDGKICERLSMGYSLNGKVIYPERVTVYKYKKEQEASEENDSQRGEK